MFTITQRSERFRDDEDILTEANVGVRFCSFLGTASLFFTGLVILRLDSLPFVVQLPVVYLVVSAVAFVISAVIYANVSGIDEKAVSRSRMIQMGNWISEYPGMYLFLIAIPLVILGVTANLLVQIATAAACYGGLLLYSISPFSLDHRRFSGVASRIGNTILLVLFSVGLYLVARLATDYLLPAGIFSLVAILGLSYFSLSTQNVAETITAARK